MGGIIIKNLSLYIHVPFCVRKCPYCDFYSEALSIKNRDLYIEKIVKDINMYSKKLSDYRVDTIYFGGGTPSLLKDKQIVGIIEAIKENFHTQIQEITIEFNPIKGNKTDFAYLRDHGVNRLSIGMQSVIEGELKALGRLHTKEDVENTITLAKKAGIDNISLDIMVAVPNQTEESLKKSIRFCAEQNVSHVSAYLLKIEEGTEYFRKKDSLVLPDDDKTSEMYMLLCEEIEKSSFSQYEISNFSKKGRESKHNLKYWNAYEYLGLGPAAHSFINGRRFYNKSSLEAFLNGESPIDDGLGGDISEYSMLRLRLTSGLNKEEFKKRFHIDIPKSYYTNAKKYESLGLTKVSDDGISFTRRGFLLSNELISRIVL